MSIAVRRIVVVAGYERSQDLAGEKPRHGRHDNRPINPGCRSAVPLLEEVERHEIAPSQASPEWFGLLASTERHSAMIAPA